MIALIFQLSGAILLANVSVKYKTVAIPIFGERIPGLQDFLKNKSILTGGLVYVIIGYAIQLVGRDIMMESLVPRLTISGCAIAFLVTLGYFIAKSIATKLYNKSEPLSPDNAKHIPAGGFVFKEVNRRKAEK